MRHRSRTAVVLALLVIVAVALGACSSGTDGASLVQSRCDTCHSVDWVTGASDAARADWEGTVARMEAKGLQVTDEERATIIDHLNATYPPE
jgi:cytochrome c5